ncbi:MAG: TldD/PmbA family protein [Candidatus Omnitrophota bacterium]
MKEKKKEKTYRNLMDRALEIALRSGADHVEVFISDSRSLTVSVHERDVDAVNAAHETGMGIRLIQDGKMASGFTNDLSPKAVTPLITELLKRVPYHSPSESHIIPTKGADYFPDQDPLCTESVSYDPQMEAIAIDEKINKAIEMETAALEFSPEIKGTLSAVYRDHTDYFYIANSNNICSHFPLSGCTGSITVSASNGNDTQSGSCSASHVHLSDLNPRNIGRQAAAKARRILGARPIPNCQIPAIIAPDVASECLSCLSGMLSADWIHKGKSPFAGKFGTCVASPIVTLIDDGKRKNGLATRPVDGEGVPQQTTVLIRNGLLTHFLYDAGTAKKDGTTSTGNRLLGNYQRQEGIRHTNLFIEPGQTEVSSLIAGMDRGFYLNHAIGLQAGINPITGDFSFPVKGFMIEKGAITFPVQGIGVSGNLLTLLRSITGVASDLQWFAGIGCPTLFVSNVQLWGSKIKSSF